MKNLVYFLILFCFSKPIFSQQSDIRKTVDSLLVNFDKFHLIPLLSDAEKRKTFKSYLFLLRKMEDEERKFKGSITFGLNGLEVENNNNFVLNTGIDLSVGNYPFEFALNSNVQAQTQNGELKETVSSLNISFDYNYSDDLSKESYVFINRSNNSLLGIDQRYEIGGGAIWNFFSGGRDSKIDITKITKEGRDKLKKILLHKESNALMDSTLFKTCVDASCSKIPGISKKDRNNLKNSRDRFARVIKKTKSKYRLSLLAGVNYELEKTIDSLALYGNESKVTNTFEATNRFRMVIRPGVTFRGDNYSFSSKAYFKFGIIGELENIVKQDLLEDEKTDYWAEWTNTLKFDFTKKIGIEVSYTFFYDNAPNRMFVNVATEENPEYKIFKAEDTFKALLFKFVYKM